MKFLTHRVHLLDGFGLKVTEFSADSGIRLIFCNKDCSKQKLIMTNPCTLSKHLIRLIREEADVVQIGNYGYWYTTMMILI